MAERKYNSVAAGTSAVIHYEDDSALPIDRAGHDGDDGTLAVASPLLPRRGSSSSQQPPLREEDSVNSNLPIDRAGHDGDDGTRVVASPLEPRRCSCSSQDSVTVTLSDNEDPASRSRIKRRLPHGDAKKFPSWVATSTDMLTEILGWLPPDRMVQAASVSKLFKEIIISDSFRSHVRSRAILPVHLLGVIPKCSDNQERYPFIPFTHLLSPLPKPFRILSSSLRFTWKPNPCSKYTEVLDSRDGKVLLLAGDNIKGMDFVIYNAHSRSSAYRKVPRLDLLNQKNVWLVTAALVPNDQSHNFSLIVLTRRGEADSRIKKNYPTTEVSVVCFTSSNGIWGQPVTTLFQMPSKTKLRLGCVLSENKLYFLHSCHQVITLDLANFKLGVIKLPKVTNIGSRTSHVICRGRWSKTVYLAVVSQRCIAIYSHDGNEWNKKFLFPSPGYWKSVAVKLVGSTDFTGLIFVKADGREVYKMDVETGFYDSISGNVPQDEVLPYKLEFPPVSQMLRQ